MRAVGIGDEAFVGVVVEDYGIVFIGIIDPSLHLRARECCASWVVRRAEVDEVGWEIGWSREEVVGFVALEVDDFLSVHERCGLVERIYRVGKEDSACAFFEDIGNVGNVFANAIADSDFVEVEVDIVVFVIAL